MPKVTFMLHVGLTSLSIPSFKPWFQSLPSQLDSWPRNQLYWGKSQLTVKPHDFWPTSTFWTHMDHLIKFGSQFHKKFDQITKRAKWSFLGFWLHKGNFWLFDLTNGKPSSHMDSRTPWNYLDMLNKFKRSQVHKIDSWISQSIDQFWLYTEKSNFDFLVKIKSQDSFFIKTCQIMKLVHQEIKKCKLGFEMRIFHNLEFF